MPTEDEALNKVKKSASKMMEQAITDPDPASRLSFITQLGQGLGPLLIMPNSWLKKLLDKTDEDLKRVKETKLEGKLGKIKELLMDDIENLLQKQVDLVRVFLDVKPEIIARMKAKGWAFPEGDEDIPLEAESYEKWMEGSFPQLFTTEESKPQGVPETPFDPSMFTSTDSMKFRN